MSEASALSLQDRIRQSLKPLGGTLRIDRVVMGKIACLAISANLSHPWCMMSV